MINEKKSPRVIVAGGGAAGFFAAIACARANPLADVRILEKGQRFLTKVRISGGGRCNVTHSCFEPRALSTRYPRGERALISAFHRFQPTDTIAWFESHGVRLKTEADGRMFPTTDSSATIVDCLKAEAEAAGVKLVTNCGVKHAARRSEGGFELTLSTGETLACDRLLLATGGSRGTGNLAEMLGHSLETPVPSLFTFHVETPWLRKLPGVAVELAEASVPGTKLRERGPVLITHWGLSGPAILRLSAWGARVLHDRDYHFPLHISWLPGWTSETILQEFQRCREQEPLRKIFNYPMDGLPSRLWEQLAVLAGISEETRWNTLTREAAREFARLLARSEFAVTGKSMNKEEFVTCGGVPLPEVDFKTMESRICPGLHFAGEVLDVDGITGGFNFQAAWTTGWIAGHAMAERPIA